MDSNLPSRNAQTLILKILQKLSMVRKKKEKRVTKDCLTIRTSTSYPKEPPSRIHQWPSRLRHSRFLSGPLTRCTRENPTLCKNTRGWRGKKRKRGAESGGGWREGTGGRCMESERDTHKRLSLANAARWNIHQSACLARWRGPAHPLYFVITLPAPFFHLEPVSLAASISSSRQLPPSTLPSPLFSSSSSTSSSSSSSNCSRLWTL